MKSRLILIKNFEIILFRLIFLKIFGLCSLIIQKHLTQDTK